LRIAYVCGDRGVPLLGHKGASIHFRSLAAALARQGNAVIIACRNAGGVNPAPQGLPVIELPEADADQRDGLRELFSESRTEAVLERYSLSSGPAQAAAHALRIPFVLEVNAPLVDEAARYRGLEDARQRRLWEAEVFRSADRVIAVSGAVRAHVVSSGVDPERVVVVHNGADLSAFENSSGAGVRARHGLGEHLVVGFSGSLKPWHGVDALVEAFALLPAGSRLLIVGDGPQREELGGLVAERGLTARAIFTGAVPHAEVPDHLAAMDIAVAPYSDQEDFYFSPLKLVEYLAAGLPVVATDQGDIREIVGEAGILVPPDDREALAAALQRLAADRELRLTLSAAARERAQGRDWAAVAGRVAAVLASPGVAV
jgi:glycosyltransferase involved in cell wall biosynthesis